MCFNVDLLLKANEHDRVFVLNDPVNWVDPWGLTRGSHYAYRLNHPDYSPESNRPGHPLSIPNDDDDCCKTTYNECRTKCEAYIDPIIADDVELAVSLLPAIASSRAGAMGLAGAAVKNVSEKAFCARACAADKCAFDGLLK